jgi:RimJ/RimL family protein N-acetyltransferase
MFTTELLTSDEKIKLVRPDVERDSELGAKWLVGDIGRETLWAMGVPMQKIQPSNIESERERVTNFLSNPAQLNWMIEMSDQVVGSIWVDLDATDYLQAPAIHIMLGDPAARGRGVGPQAFRTVIDYLAKERKVPTIYTRHLVDNVGAANMIAGAGFQIDGDSYDDQDGLVWQNMKLETTA